MLQARYLGYDTWAEVRGKSAYSTFKWMFGQFAKSICEEYYARADGDDVFV